MASAHAQRVLKGGKSISMKGKPMSMMGKSKKSSKKSSSSKKMSKKTAAPTAVPLSAAFTFVVGFNDRSISKKDIEEKLISSLAFKLSQRRRLDSDILTALLGAWKFILTALLGAWKLVLTPVDGCGYLKCIDVTFFASDTGIDAIEEAQEENPEFYSEFYTGIIDGLGGGDDVCILVGDDTCLTKSSPSDAPSSQPSLSPSDAPSSQPSLSPTVCGPATSSSDYFQLSFLGDDLCLEQQVTTGFFVPCNAGAVAQSWMLTSSSQIVNKSSNLCLEALSIAGTSWLGLKGCSVTSGFQQWELQCGGQRLYNPELGLFANPDSGQVFLTPLEGISGLMEWTPQPV